MKWLFLKVFFVSFLMVSTSCSSDDKVETPNQSYENKIMTLINKHRKSVGLQELAILEVIKSQTDHHTDYMINQGKISHDKFSERFEYLKNNAKAIAIAENVAAGQSSAETLVNSWLDSSVHKDNIEGNYTHFNLTAKQDNNGVWYYTNIFIRVE